MLDKQRGRIVFQCDADCNDTLETNEKDFNLAMLEFRKEGWQAKKENIWLHFCPEHRH